MANLGIYIQDIYYINSKIGGHIAVIDSNGNELSTGFDVSFNATKYQIYRAIVSQAKSSMLSIYGTVVGENDDITLFGSVHKF